MPCRSICLLRMRPFSREGNFAPPCAVLLLGILRHLCQEWGTNNPFVMHGVPYTRLTHLTLPDIKSSHGVCDNQHGVDKRPVDFEPGLREGEWGVVSQSRGRVRGATR